jgi:hypothetical protein
MGFLLVLATFILTMVIYIGLISNSKEKTDYDTFDPLKKYVAEMLPYAALFFTFYGISFFLYTFSVILIFCLLKIGILFL